MERVKDIMTREPACCSPESSLQEAAKMMYDFNCGEIPVIDRETQKPVGVITDRDITCRATARGRNALEMKVSDCMTTPCITVKPETSLEDCCSLFEEHQIRRVPVVDEEGRCCGIVSQADIALNASIIKVAEVVREVSKAA